MGTPLFKTFEQEHIEPAPLIGRDEMNLAEFPIALLADFAPKNQKTLYFEGGEGQLTVTGSDAYGLPTALDADVIVALIYLTKQRNDFREVKVNFSRYELIQLLNWPDKGSSYKRLDQALNRWGGVWLVYDKCWWNNRLKRFVSAKMHILESVVITESGKSGEGQPHLPLSTFTWNKTFIESCQADNLRQLDLDTYFSLKSAISKRLYRFLGKRFWRQDDWTFDLAEIAFDRVGLSRSYAGNAGKIKEKLQSSLEELETIGFLKPMARDDRYSRVDRGHWTIRLARQSASLSKTQTLSPEQKPTLPPLVIELITRGITAKAAGELVRDFGEEKVQLQLDIFDGKPAKKRDKIDDQAAYLVKAIRDGHAAPKNFKTKAQREQEAEATRQQQKVEADQQRQTRELEARKTAARTAGEAQIRQLTPEDRAALQVKLLAQASERTRQLFQAPPTPTYPDTMMHRMMLEHFHPILKNEE